MSRPGDIEQNTVFGGKLITVRQDVMTLPDGTIKLWDVVEYPPAVAIVAVDDNGDILLVRQYRHAVEADLLEIPAGGIDPGETPEEAVCREMQEETGYFPGSVQRLTCFYSAPGYSTEILYLFLATDLTPARLVAEDTDEITLLRAQKNDVLKMIGEGAIRDSKSIAGLLFYFRSC